MRLSEQEQQLIETLREWSGDDDYRVVIEFCEGAWTTIYSRYPHDKAHRATATEASFDRAWDKMGSTKTRKPVLRLIEPDDGPSAA